MNTLICLASAAPEAPIGRVLARTGAPRSGQRSSRGGVRAMPGVPGPEPDYTSRRAPRGGAARGRFRVGPRGVFTSGRASARVSARGGHPAAAPPAAGEGPTDRPTDRGRDRRTQRPSEEPRARGGAGPHERAVSGDSAAAGACRRGGTQPWTG